MKLMLSKNKEFIIIKHGIIILDIFKKETELNINKNNVPSLFPELFEGKCTLYSDKQSIHWFLGLINGWKSFFTQRFVKYALRSILRAFNVENNVDVSYLFSGQELN